MSRALPTTPPDDLGDDDDTTEEMPRPMTERERKAADKRARRQRRNQGVR